MNINGYMDLVGKNVIEPLKGKGVEEIKAFCQANSIPAAVAMVNVNYDFNIAGLIRNANFFGYRAVYHVQKEGRRYDKRGTVGLHNYTDIIHVKDTEELMKEICADYVPIAIEIDHDGIYSNKILRADDLWKIPNPCFIFGAEGTGLDPEFVTKCSYIFTIPGRGAARSLNVGSCSAAVMALHTHKLGLY